MWLIREIANDEEEKKEVEQTSSDVPQPVVPESGWNVGHLAHHGILLSCDNFTLKLDLDQLNALFDLAEDGETGEIRDHSGKIVTVEVTDDSIILTRNGDEAYPNGVALDLDTLKEMGIEQHEDAAPAGGDEPPAGEESTDEQPADDASEEETDDTMVSDDEEDELKEGVKRAFRRAGKKIKRGFRVTSGWRKGRVVANIKTAHKPRPKAKTRMKLRIAGKKKRFIKLLKARRTRRKPISKRLKRMNAKVSGK